MRWNLRLTFSYLRAAVKYFRHFGSLPQGHSVLVFGFSRRGMIKCRARDIATRPGEKSPITDEHRMEQLSRAYVQAVAAVSGCRWSVPTPDYGVDMTLRQVVFRRGRWQEKGSGLDLQLKSEAGATVAPDHVIHDLKADAYDLLRRATRNSPALLVLLVLPVNRAEWVGHNEERLELRGCASWLSLRGAPASENTSSVRARIPRANQFTPAALPQIMEAVRRRSNI